jgi:hypothetical protein
LPAPDMSSSPMPSMPFGLSPRPAPDMRGVQALMQRPKLGILGR